MANGADLLGRKRLCGGYSREEGEERGRRNGRKRLCFRGREEEVTGLFVFIKLYYLPYLSIHLFICLLGRKEFAEVAVLSVGGGGGWVKVVEME